MKACLQKTCGGGGILSDTEVKSDTCRTLESLTIQDNTEYYWPYKQTTPRKPE